MWRGIAVDRAICKALEEPDTNDEALQKIALMEFERLYAEASENGEYDDKKVYREQLAVSGYLGVALPHFRQLGTPTHTQEKIVVDIGLSVPIVGYIDLSYEGVVRDIKTVNRLPSRVPSATARQLSIYAQAKDSIPIVDYVHNTKTTQQVVTMSVPDHKSHWNMAVKTANNMARLLSFSSDIQEIAGLLMPDFDDWRWSSGEKEAAKRLWRLNDDNEK